jgi:hypothetical protein
MAVTLASQGVCERSADGGSVTDDRAGRWERPRRQANPVDDRTPYLDGCGLSSMPSPTHIPIARGSSAAAEARGQRDVA